MEIDNRSQNTIQQDTAISSPNFRCFNKVSNSNITVNVKRNSKFNSVKSLRAGPPDTVFYLASIHNTEIQRKKSNNFQSQGIKSVYETKAFPSVSPSPSAKFSTTRRLDGETGLKSSLLPPASKGSTQKVSPDQLSRSTTTDDVSAVRPGSSATDFRLGNELDRRNTSQKRTEVSGLFRRLSDNTSGQKYAYNTDRICNTVFDQSGLVDQYGEIDNNTNEVNRFSGSHMGHQIQHEVPTLRENTTSSSDVARTTRSRQLEPKTGATPIRSSQLCNLHHPPGKDALPITAATQQQTQEVSKIADSVSKRGTYRTKMVDGEYQSEVSDSSHKKADEPRHHRRVGHSMGSSGEQRHDKRPMGATPGKMALQSEGNVCCDSRYISQSNGAPEFYSDSSERQQNSRVLYKKRRRNTITSIARSDPTAAGTGGPPQHCASASPPTRPVQHRSRSPLTKSRRRRVAPHRRGNIETVRHVGHARPRPLCVTDSTCRTKLCFARLVRLERLLSRRVQQILALPTCMAVPAAQPNTQGTGSPQFSLRSVHSSSTQVDEAFLEARPEESGSETSRETQKSREDAGGHSDNATAGTSQQVTPGSLAHFGWDVLTDTWTPQEKQLLSSCWRQSTIKTYAPIWSRWVRFCQENCINFRLPEPVNVARYLGYLFLTDGLAYRTILVHKSVIASVCETISDVKITANPIVKHILKAISVARPAPSQLPIWDARILIRFLKSYNINLNSVYQVSRHTAAILLLSSGRRIHDLTLLHTDNQHFVDNTDSITLHPAFGSKTDSSSYQQSSWTFLAAPEKSIDAVYWLRTLVNMTQGTRGNITNLFLATRSPTRPATAAMIGGWIKRLLADAGIQTSAGSCRSAVSSLNWVENYHINDILAKANWQHEFTFKKFYLKQINNSNREIRSEKSLSQYFQPDS